MFNKTTSFIFNKYGQIISDQSRRPNTHLTKNTWRLKDKSFSSFYIYDQDIFVRVTSGIVMLVVSNNEFAQEFERFVIHRYICIKAGVRFNFLSISSTSKVEVEVPTRAKKDTTPTFQDQAIFYEPIVPTFTINEILGCYYQIRDANYTFTGEKHNYWELTFIDNGELTTIIDEESYSLSKLDFILYSPNQFHSQQAGNSQTCSYLTISFDMKIPDSYLITNRVYSANRDIHNTLDNFIKVSSIEALYDSELMLCYLKELIIKVLQYDFTVPSNVASTPMQQRFESEMLNEIILYINDTIYEQITIEEICVKFSISRSSLQTLFRNNIGVAPKQYISDIKLKKSKHLIKESVYTISEIAAMLGFTSIHYFSRKFKQQFNITPTDYAKTIYN